MRSIKIIRGYLILEIEGKEIHRFTWSNVRELAGWNTLVKNWIVWGIWRKRI